MSNVSKCFSCVHKNDYDPKFGYYGCNLSGQECKGYSMFEPKVKPKPITNADRLRGMRDEELAELFQNLCCPYSLGGKVDCNIKNRGCGNCWLSWLKSPVKEGEG